MLTKIKFAIATIIVSVPAWAPAVAHAMKVKWP
jgi:hypothetical protein